MKKIILASSSVYRKELLARLKIPFECFSPSIDETPYPLETPVDLVKRLAYQKAKKIANQYPSGVVIGSDQIALFNHQIMGKPGNHKNATEQLSLFSGHQIQFLTAVSVVNQQQNFVETQVSITKVKFRKLEGKEIEHYLIKDTPYDCAGSFKIESLGSCLFETVTSDDPTSLQGLPLIMLCKLLNNAGINLI